MIQAVSSLQKVRTLLALGSQNLVRILLYRSSIKFGFNPVLRLKERLPQAPFYNRVDRWQAAPESVNTWKGVVKIFGCDPFPVSDHAPEWHTNPLTGRRFPNTEREWWKIPDFDPAVGDIKLVWELSRFDWVLAFAQRARCGEKGTLEKLNAWLVDWCEHNPPYIGPNWKCGQEASIRLMHLAVASMILQQAARPAKGLLELIRLHLLRIEPTLGYSIAQNNNHGTSEAAALFVGGSWLSMQGYKEAERWARKGRQWLEERVGHLIEVDGSFSQYSVNYHRVLLDTLSIVEVWRRHLDLGSFSSAYNVKVAAAAGWLAALVDPVSGDAPNIGANDGARLLQLTETDYRDFRPSVQLAVALFSSSRQYDADGSWNDQLRWLGIAVPAEVIDRKGSQVFDDGGYAVLKNPNAMAVLRYPRFRFRPGHADALHLDFWLGGVNLLRDGGTFSYNTDREWLDYFPGTASHNTVQFDERDQMPRISRFLYGDWLKTASVRHLADKNGKIAFGASYRDRQGARHQRDICLKERSLSVRDEVSGFTSKAVLRWRLRPGAWRLDGQCLNDGVCRIMVTSNVGIERLELTRGWESRYYYQKTEIPVLEIEIRKPGILTTELTW